MLKGTGDQPHVKARAGRAACRHLGARQGTRLPRSHPDSDRRLLDTTGSVRHTPAFSKSPGQFRSRGLAPPIGNSTQPREGSRTWNLSNGRKSQTSSPAKSRRSHRRLGAASSTPLDLDTAPAPAVVNSGLQSVADAIAFAATDPESRFWVVVGHDASLIVSATSSNSSMSFEEFEQAMRSTIHWFE